MEKAEALNAFSASISTADMLLGICMYQHDLWRRGTANTGKQQVKGGNSIQGQVARQLSPKAAEKSDWVCARRVSSMKNYDEMFWMIVERLILHELLKRARRCQESYINLWKEHGSSKAGTGDQEHIHKFTKAELYLINLIVIYDKMTGSMVQ